MSEQDPFEFRRRLTFEQAEGAELPTQLKLKEVSPELRARLWEVVHASLENGRSVETFGGREFLANPWGRILKHLHVNRDYGMVDEFRDDFRPNLHAIKQIFLKGDYLQIFGWLQAVLRLGPPQRFPERIDAALKAGRSPYRVLDGQTIVPVGSEAELETLKKADADLAASEFHGARAHLRTAAERLTEGRWSDSIRESIHAVESVARVLEPSGEFSKAIAKLEHTAKIHGAMKAGFGSLYGYTSDEKGIRHPLLDDGNAGVDEHDALFMIGACAAFASYMINKAKAAGLLKTK